MKGLDVRLKGDNTVGPGELVPQSIFNELHKNKMGAYQAFLITALPHLNSTWSTSANPNFMRWWTMLLVWFSWKQAVKMIWASAPAYSIQFTPFSHFGLAKQSTRYLQTRSFHVSVLSSMLTMSHGRDDWLQVAKVRKLKLRPWIY